MAANPVSPAMVLPNSWRCAFLLVLLTLAVSSVNAKSLCDGFESSATCPCIVFGPAEGAPRVTNAANPNDGLLFVGCTPPEATETSYSCSDWSYLQALIASKGDGSASCVINVVLVPGQSYEASGVQFEVSAEHPQVVFTSPGTYELSANDRITLGAGQNTRFIAAGPSQLKFQNVGNVVTGGSGLTEIQNVGLTFAAKPKWMHRGNLLNFIGSTIAAGPTFDSGALIDLTSSFGSITATSSTFDLTQAPNANGISGFQGSGNVRLTSCKVLGVPGGANYGVYLSQPRAGAVVIESTTFSELSTGVFVQSPVVNLMVTVRGSTFIRGRTGVDTNSKAPVLIEQSTFLEQSLFSLRCSGQYGTANPLTVSRSTFARSQFGALLALGNPDPSACTPIPIFVLNTCTFSDIAATSIIAEGVDVQVLSSTIADSGGEWASNRRGGPFCTGNTIGSLYLANTIVTSSQGGCQASGVPFTSGGGNIIRTTDSDTCAFPKDNPLDIYSSDPKYFQLGALADNGGPTGTSGPTFTRALLTDGTTNYAVGFSTDCDGKTDQRGVERKTPKCDTGAYESAAVPVTPVVANCKQDFQVEATSLCAGATPSATELFDGSVPATYSLTRVITDNVGGDQNPPTLGYGSHTYSLTATDNGQSSTCMGTINVYDGENLVENLLECPSVTKVTPNQANSAVAIFKTSYNGGNTKKNGCPVTAAVKPDSVTCDRCNKQGVHSKPGCASNIAGAQISFSDYGGNKNYISWMAMVTATYGDNKGPIYRTCGVCVENKSGSNECDGAWVPGTSAPCGK